MSDFTAHIANCLIWGDIFEKDGSTKLSLFLEKKHMEIIQKPEILRTNKLRDNFHGRLFPSTTLIVRDVTEDELHNIEDLINSLCFLLSFITCSQVVFYGQKYPKHTSFWAIVGKTNIYGNLIDIRDGVIVKDFIITVWKKYRQVLKERRLDMIFDYLHNANFPGNTIESKLIFSFITLESLKYTFALNKKNISFDKDKKCFRKQNEKKTYGFLELLEMMFKEVGIKFTNKEIIKSLRDEIIHSGLSQNDFSHNFKIYREVQNLIRSYLCKLIGYNKIIRKI